MNSSIHNFLITGRQVRTASFWKMNSIKISARAVTSSPGITQKKGLRWSGMLTVVVW